MVAAGFCPFPDMLPSPFHAEAEGAFQASFLSVRVPNVPPVNTPPVHPGGGNKLTRRGGAFF